MKKLHTHRSVMGGESTDVPVPESVGSGRAARMFAGERALVVVPEQGRAELSSHSADISL